MNETIKTLIERRSCRAYENTEVEAFSYGVQLGVKLMIEANIPLTKGTT